MQALSLGIAIGASIDEACSGDWQIFPLQYLSPNEAYFIASDFVVSGFPSMRKGRGTAGNSWTGISETPVGNTGFPESTHQLVFHQAAPPGAGEAGRKAPSCFTFWCSGPYRRNFSPALSFPRPATPAPRPSRPPRFSTPLGPHGPTLGWHPASSLRAPTPPAFP